MDDQPEPAAWEMSADQEKADRAGNAAKRLGPDPMPEINTAKPTSKLPTPAGLPVMTTIGIRG